VGIRFCNNEKERVGTQAEKIPIWIKEITKDVESKFDAYALQLGFTSKKTYHCVYFKLIGNDLIYLVLYVVICC